ncbi:hypothetical protein ACQKFS_18510 [Pseudomonas guineae]|uniref:hypothetical protein n=1 Tax=Pseudomonas guineae TaxID=425504 RepID=UPI003D0132E3
MPKTLIPIFPKEQKILAEFGARIRLAKLRRHLSTETIDVRAACSNDSALLAMCGFNCHFLACFGLFWLVLACFGFFWQKMAIKATEPLSVHRVIHRIYAVHNNKFIPASGPLTFGGHIYANNSHKSSLNTS